MHAAKSAGSKMRDAERPRHGISAANLYEAALRCTDARICGAILAVASLDDGMTLTEAARTWRVDLATLRDVIGRLDESGLDGLGHLIVTPGANTSGNCPDPSNPKTRR
jgi:hypothetical protein